MNKIKGGVIPTGFIPAVEKGVVDAMRSGVVAGYPLRDVRVTLYDGSYHSVDSSENAFKVAGSMAFKKAAEQAQPTLLEPIMQAQVVVPEDAVGDVIGDLNGRRGRPLGMEPKGAMTEIKAEVPMAEMLNYAPDLRSITGGRGDYSMEFVRYEEVPAHLAQKVISAATQEEESAAPRRDGHRRARRSTSTRCRRTTSRARCATARCSRASEAEPYLTPSRERRLVCQLCAPRAQHEGWIREAAAPEMPARPHASPSAAASCAAGAPRPRAGTDP